MDDGTYSQKSNVSSDSVSSVIYKSLGLDQRASKTLFNIADLKNRLPEMTSTELETAKGELLYLSE